ncbi:MAG TPA: hypothetical protein P5184_03015 [Bacteroidales bacterium]|nr:hypothetical protein [Bacteroidales bacterium]
MGNKFDYVIEKDETVGELRMRIPSMIIQPYAENAVWHGLSSLKEMGRISILFRLLKPNVLQITVEDNGIGMKRAATYTSNSEAHLRMGMAMTLKRLEIIGRKYRIETSVSIAEALPGTFNPGTRVVIVVPVWFSKEGSQEIAAGSGEVE